jgi:hypothetical protein
MDRVGSWDRAECLKNSEIIFPMNKASYCNIYKARLEHI